MNQMPMVRETQMKRRRSRVPWIYLVYHARLRGSAARTEEGRDGGSATPDGRAGIGNDDPSSGADCVRREA